MKKPLSFGRMLAFAIGDIFGGGSFNIINFLYPGFLALAVGLPPRLAGLVILIARIFDAVSDPVMGVFSDRLRVRFGTRRSTLLISAPLVVLSMFLMFYPYNSQSVTVRFWSVLLSYIFFYAVQTSIMIPYHSLSSELTEDYTERAKLSTLRMAFSIFSSIVCVAVPRMIVSRSEGNTGYIIMSFVFGMVFMISVGITAVFAKEGIPPPKKVQSFVLKDFVRPFLAKPFRQYLLLYLCCQMTMAVMSALFFFYVDFYFCRDMTMRGEKNITGLLSAGIMFGMQIAALPVYLAVIKKVNKTIVYIAGSVIWIISALFLFILPANSSPVPLYILAAVLGFGLSGPGLIPHAIFPDVIDAAHLQFGDRTAGSFSGIANLVNKVASAAGLAIVMTVIGVAGFIEQDIRPGAEKVVLQSFAAQQAIVTIMALAPLVFMTAGIVVCIRYRLNRERHARVLAVLDGSDEEKAAVLRSL